MRILYDLKLRKIKKQIVEQRIFSEISFFLPEKSVSNSLRSVPEATFTKLHAFNFVYSYKQGDI